ncbi:hypothetical protein MIN45_P1751 [Methylomarinovum tepidoasis]|uniref:Uncharacterized protein n=1 Tax=Methylomarinovum tepidoasis TaxID=2840183 RepID=A0AAU9D319_9GAMM|nr:hypothetical protein [Methylomarinovum sp. IN45]BCX89379.1 hypothetical protein MIN45_P1751 [Methylomarinovum sp. IN45]
MQDKDQEVSVKDETTKDTLYVSGQDNIGVPKIETDQKTEEHQSIEEEVPKEDPQILTELFERLLRGASEAYYARLGKTQPDNLAEKIKSFAERAAGHPVIGQFFLSLEQPNIRSAELRDKQTDAIVQKHGLDSGRGGAYAKGLPERLSGSFQEVALQATLLLRQHQGDARFALALTCGPLADALESMERTGLSRERQVDLMIHLFAGEPVYEGGGTRPPCNPKFREFLARLSALVLSEAAERPTPGRFQTLVSLATWYGSAREPACIACGAALGLEILPYGYEIGDAPQEVAKALSQLANNLAGWLSRLLGFGADEDAMHSKPEQAGQLNAVHAFGCVAFLQMTSWWSWNEGAAEVFGCLKVEMAKEKAGGLARAFLFMANVPPAWRILNKSLFASEDQMFGPAARRLRTAVLSLISALMRARFNEPKDHDEIAQALFNLGVDLNIHSKSSGDPATYLPPRLLANALGLWWALMKAGDETQAIGPFNGGDCAVNLFGALTEPSLAEFRRQHAEAIRALGDALRTQMKQMNLELDESRLSASYNEMFGQKPEHAPLEREKAATTLAGLIQAYLDANGFEAKPVEADLHTWLGAAFETAAAEIMRWAFSQIEEGPSVFDNCLQGWVAVAGKLVQLAEEPGYTAFRGEIPSSLQDFGITGYQCDRPDIPKADTHYLSRTLRDVELMCGVFGLS